MFDALIRLSLRHRALVLVGALVVAAGGAAVLAELPVDVFPDLNRPTVTVMTEAGGLSPEEVEILVTRPIEVAMSGAPGVRRVRSSSGVGLSVIAVEFDWGSDLLVDRQLTSERLQLARERLPQKALPAMAPVSSIMGEILLLGVQAEGATTAVELRTLSDWTLRQRLLSIPGVAQVTVMGGGVKQLQVQVDPARLLSYGLTFEDVARAAGLSQGSTTGGFLELKSQELLVRNLARSATIEDLASTAVAIRDGVPILLKQVADVRLGTAVKRGDGGMNGAPAVILAVQKQPGANTLALTAAVERALAALRPTLPADVKVTPLFEQARFIRSAVENVSVALRDGALLVLLVLSLFLLSARTTAITLTAIPLSFLVTALVLKALGISVNTMTLGGLAVAIGELVDDAIVDVENVHRRLRENAQKQSPLPSLAVVYRASSEVRGSIVFATAVVVLVFVPLFAMGGIEGRLFAPLGAAYLISILASLLVSLTVTPALCSLLLPAALQAAGEEGRLVRFLKRHDAAALERTLDHPGLLISMALALVGCAVLSLPLLGREFLPAFNEGTATISLLARPGTSLEESNRIGLAAERLLLATPEVLSVGRRTGRAEQDEHAEGVHSSELDVDFKPEGRPRQVVLDELRRSLGQLPGVTVNLGQPISHRLDHLLSGVRAQLAVKLFGPDLEALRGKAAEVQHALSEVPGVVDLQVEQQLLIPELKIRVRREDAARYGLEPGALTERLEGALAGRVVAQVVEGPRTVDIVVRYDEASRKDVESLKRALFDTPSGARVPLAAIADVEEGTGPNLINHENGQRRLVVSANVAGRDLGAVVDELRARVSRQVTLPQGMTLSFEGQLESRESATRLIALLSLLSLLAMIAVLHAHFRSPVLVALVLLNIPLAMVGSVAALLVTSRTLSVATLVGFVTLCGIASRNTIMMLSHYLHLVAEEGERFDRAMVIRGSLERLVPVLMTALTAALGLVPLALAHGEAGKEILQPMAVVILGGLFSSTLLDVLLTPAMFLRFGEKAVARHVERQRQGDGL